MDEPVEWLADGTPYSPRFADRYRSETGGGLHQAQGVFMAGCGLPGAWAGRPHFSILETGFGLGLNFLTAWQAWRADPARPRQLHFVSVEAWPVSADDLRRSVEMHPALQPLAQALIAQYEGLRPGVHRLRFEDGQVLLTLAIGPAVPMLRELVCEADAVFLDGFSPALNPEIWDAATLKAVAHRCRPGARLATWTIARSVRDALSQAGFQCERVPGVPPKRDRLQAVYAPAWTPRRRLQAWQDTGPLPASGTCTVLGAGLAGACVARALAERGWQVQVLDAADQPAAGASALPAGLFAPHDTAEDTPLSQLTRSGARCTAALLRRLLASGQDYAIDGVLERRLRGAAPLPVNAPADAFGRPADPQQLEVAGLPADAARWHALAGWVRPARLVQALLDHPGIRLRANCKAAQLLPWGEGWRLAAADGTPLHDTALLLVAGGIGSAELLRASLAHAPDLRAVRGQVSFGPWTPGVPAPPWPVNGHGHFIGRVPGDGGPFWITGSTFGRGELATDLRDEDQADNLARLATLLPATARALAAGPPPSAWAGVRCTSPDRLPLAGPLQPGLWLLTALGARGLTLAPLLAELLAARLNDEPLPLPARLVAALDPRR